MYKNNFDKGILHGIKSVQEAISPLVDSVIIT